MPVILPFQIPCTHKDVIVTILTDDFSFVQNLYEEEKMELFSEITFNMYRASSLYYVAATSRGNVLANGNSSK